MPLDLLSPSFTTSTFLTGVAALGGITLPLTGVAVLGGGAFAAGAGLPVTVAIIAPASSSSSSGGAALAITAAAVGVPAAPLVATCTPSGSTFSSLLIPSLSARCSLMSATTSCGT